MSEIVENPYLGLDKNQKSALAYKELKRGFSPMSLKRYLVHSGETEEEADLILQNAKSIINSQNHISEKTEEKDAYKDFLWGFLLLGGGILLSIFSNGYFFYGAIIYGLIRIVMGIISYSKS